MIHDGDLCILHNVNYPIRLLKSPNIAQQIEVVGILYPNDLALVITTYENLFALILTPSSYGYISLFYLKSV